MQTIEKFPHNDEILQYDYNRHRYMLTQDALYKYVGIDFNELPDEPGKLPGDKAFIWANKSAEEVYRFLQKNNYNPQWLMWELATVPELREVVKDLLIAQAEYNKTSGFIDHFSGIDVFRGKAIDRKDIHESCISPAIEDIAMTLQPCIGRALCCAVPFGGRVPPYCDTNGNPIW